MFSPSIFWILLFAFPLTSVPLDPDQKVYHLEETFQKDFFQISFPENSLVRSESRNRWRAVPLKGRSWLVVWRKLDRTGEFESAKKSLAEVFPGKAPEQFSVQGIEIFRWEKSDLSGGNPLKIFFFLLQNQSFAYSVYVSFFPDQKNLEDWFGVPNRYVKP
ncbi:hypothetical protein CH373_09850 [Leptospira perolatii]|uniref:Uncharacterized protein n=1 Tax=Leptospira perolatii TaxID=2023191 RepID=A0A2M9ZMU1_9LEPT|nr:hypothetical protein CH360_07595 [Leptospira perolatii]PJZ73396.1 hypothetical protein CH373_09850 [Leptospira perolatii]